jgi:hypothetical protein
LLFGERMRGGAIRPESSERLAPRVDSAGYRNKEVESA